MTLVDAIRCTECGARLGRRRSASCGPRCARTRKRRLERQAREAIALVLGVSIRAAIESRRRRPPLPW